MQSANIHHSDRLDELSTYANFQIFIFSLSLINCKNPSIIFPSSAARSSIPIVSVSLHWASKPPVTHVMLQIKWQITEKIQWHYLQCPYIDFENLPLGLCHFSEVFLAVSLFFILCWASIVCRVETLGLNSCHWELLYGHHQVLQSPTENRWILFFVIMWLQAILCNY